MSTNDCQAISTEHDTDATLRKRFWSKVRRDTFEGCWEWAAGTDHYGYAWFNPGGGPVHASRVSYRLATGRDPNKLHVLHSCDNTLCVNPAHLFLGTQADNVRDMCQKGRARKKLTIEAVREIREALKTDTSLGRFERVAPRFGVTPEMVSMIYRRKCWAHVA